MVLFVLLLKSLFSSKVFQTQDWWYSPAVLQISPQAPGVSCKNLVGSTNEKRTKVTPSNSNETEVMSCWKTNESCITVSDHSQIEKQHNKTKQHKTRHSTERNGTERHNGHTTLHCTALHSTTQHDTNWKSTIQPDTTLHYTALHYTALQ